MLELQFEFLNFLKATSYAGTRTNIRTGALGGLLDLFCILYSVRPQGMTSGSSFYQAPCFYREVFNSGFEHKMTGRREKAT